MNEEIENKLKLHKLLNRPIPDMTDRIGRFNKWLDTLEERGEVVDRDDFFIRLSRYNKVKSKEEIENEVFFYSLFDEMTQKYSALVLLDGFSRLDLLINFLEYVKKLNNSTCELTSPINSVDNFFSSVDEMNRPTILERIDYLTEKNWLEFLKFEKNKKEADKKAKEAEETRILAIINGADELQVFKTTLDDRQRKELCDYIIKNNGHKKADLKGEDTALFIDIKEQHRATLNYLLGGERPEPITPPIKIHSTAKIYSLLNSISLHKDDRTKKIIVPDFVRNTIGKEILRDRNGDELKNGIKQ